jgi:trk system potassium uptake protein TrkH
VTKPLRVMAAIGQILRLFSITFTVPIVISLLYDPWDSQVWFLHVPSMIWPFILAMILCLGLSYLFAAITSKVQNDDLQDKEAYLTVGIGWLTLTVIAALPFWASGVLPNFIDAFFEAMSGLTTTGATVIAGELELVPKSVMIWRALLQYMGGMGIIVLSVALLARLTQGGLQLLQAEAPGPSVTRLRPKLAQTAKTLWAVYGILSAALFVILFLVIRFQIGMSWGDSFYDALLHTFTTISTGGFSNHTVGISFFDSWLMEAVLILFMLIAGSNFTLHYYALRGDWRRLVRDREWRMFMGIFFGSTIFAALFVWGAGQNLGLSLRDAAFTVASLGTSTGFATANYDLWPDPVRLILIILMFTGATAGSTAGGLKVVRILILMKVVGREFKKLLHPRAVVPIRLAGRPLKDDTVMAVVAFFFSFITIWMLGALFLIATDPMLNAFDGAVTAASAMGNVGPAMGALNPTMTFAGLLPSSKIVVALLMWIGRLEVFTALILFAPQTWKN